MGLFDLFKKKKVNTHPAQKQNEGNNIPLNNTNPTVKEESHPAKPWLDRYYMSGYDVGQIEGYTDLSNQPRCDEEGTENTLKWERYGTNIIITGLTNRGAQSIEIPQTINGYTVAGIARMAFLDCQIRTIVIPSSVEYIGGMAAGFVSRSVFSDDEEREIRTMKPFAHNWPTSTFMNKEYFLHIDPKTIIIGSQNTIAEKYAISHHLPFSHK